MDDKNRGSINPLDEWKRLERAQRIQERNEREAVRKEQNHRFFILGKLLIEIIPLLNEIKVFKGKDSSTKNNASFTPFRNFLKELATNDEILARLEEMIKEDIAIEK